MNGEFRLSIETFNNQIDIDVLIEVLETCKNKGAKFVCMHESIETEEVTIEISDRRLV